MSDVFYIDRISKKIVREKVYKESYIRLLYGESWLTRLFSPLLIFLTVKWPFFSRIYGYFQKTASSKKKIKPFIEEFEVDTSEFLQPVDQFSSFNDFFIRKLKPTVRPLMPDPSVAIIPADGRYYFYQNIEESPGFIVKGQKFQLKELLQNDSLVETYRNASMVMARLCPSDYHRFHFPCDCFPSETRFINGHLYSVNPMAIKKNIQIFSQNKRTICELQSPLFGNILYMEIGATNVGSIKETYIPGQFYLKGAEKGYFEFGGSSLILLFPQGSIAFDEDLLKATHDGLEIKCMLGQSMGKHI